MKQLKLILICGAGTLAASCVTVPPAEGPGAMIRRETAVWQAAEDAKPEVFGSFLDAGYSGVYADGVHSRDTEIAAVRQAHLRSFALSSTVAVQVDAHTERLTYKITVKGDVSGADFSGDYGAMSVWHATGGHWLLVAHAETKLPSGDTTAKTKESSTEQVTGIGGVFFKVKNPKVMAAWYRKNLGVQSQHGFADFTWREQDHPAEIGHTTWAIFPTNTTYFGDSPAPMMIDYRVANLDRLLAQLRASGVKIEKVDEAAYGRFAWITDPDGNRVELWEPKEK